MKKYTKRTRLLQNKESIFTMLASESILKKEWDNKLDERWENI
jgi:hypothetical protein